MTNLEKMMEVFPQFEEERIRLCCPDNFIKVPDEECETYGDLSGCSKCREKFWNAEYQEVRR